MAQLAAAVEAYCVYFTLPCKHSNMLISSANARNLQAIKERNMRRAVLFLGVAEAEFPVGVLPKAKYQRITAKYHFFWLHFYK